MTEEKRPEYTGPRYVTSDRDDVRTMTREGWSLLDHWDEEEELPQPAVFGSSDVVVPVTRTRCRVFLLGKTAATWATELSDELARAHEVENNAIEQTMEAMTMLDERNAKISSLQDELAHKAALAETKAHIANSAREQLARIESDVAKVREAIGSDRWKEIVGNA